MQICSLCFGRCENWDGYQSRCQANDEFLRKKYTVEVEPWELEQECVSEHDQPTEEVTYGESVGSSQEVACEIDEKEPQEYGLEVMDETMKTENDAEYVIIASTSGSQNESMVILLNCLYFAAY